jgi:hypothetical protein
MTEFVSQTVEVLDCYEGRDAAITFTLYLCCLISGFYSRKTKLHRSLQRIFHRLEDCRVVLRLYDDLTILRDLFTYELRPGVRLATFFSVGKLSFSVGTKLDRSWTEMSPLSRLAWLLPI